ncbi:MAG: S46 family peptidase, partial [Bacteroidales bacterium]|nr:S46 family peptidase [Bacteroidales bacterium]
MKKGILILMTLVVMAGVKVKADEGMWLPMFIERLNYVDMEKMGLQLTPEEIYSVNHASLKDAIIGLSEGPNPQGYFCTGELVSKQGLMFTNHHCGYDAIQKHSSLEHDYLADGFWAMSMDEELPNEGLSASILYRMADVTDSIVPFLSDTLSAAERTAAIREITSRLKKQASEDGKYNVVVKGFFSGNEYYMFVYTVYRDVRLVGAPPSSIGKFGGDTDNWMWPRHTGDFSFFRIYANKDNQPAEYAADNVPYQPKKYFAISMDGVKKDDFTMVFGYPYKTEEYLTSYAIQQKLEIDNPHRIKARQKKIDILN